MAKKRKGKSRQRRPSRSSRSSSRRSSRLNVNKSLRALRIADILVSIAIIFTLINALLVLILPNLAVEAAANYGINSTTSSWMTLGVAWIFLALFAHWANKVVKATLDRRPMWGLLILGLLLGITARIESALLLVVASLTYLVKTRKRR